jgi:hypothetical protein
MYKVETLFGVSKCKALADETIRKKGEIEMNKRNERLWDYAKSNYADFTDFQAVTKETGDFTDFLDFYDLNNTKNEYYIQKQDIDSIVNEYNHDEKNEYTIERYVTKRLVENAIKHFEFENK